MPKKLVRKTRLQTTQVDWKFIVILLGMTMIGLTLWAMNQRISYRSSASWDPENKLRNCTRICELQKREKVGVCKARCWEKYDLTQ